MNAASTMIWLHRFAASSFFYGLHHLPVAASHCRFGSRSPAARKSVPLYGGINSTGSCIPNMLKQLHPPCGQATRRFASSSWGLRKHICQPRIRHCRVHATIPRDPQTSLSQNRMTPVPRHTCATSSRASPSIRQLRRQAANRDCCWSPSHRHDLN